MFKNVKRMQCLISKFKLTNPADSKNGKYWLAVT